MTRVCLVGSDGYDIRSALFSRETARDALSTYRLDQPYANTLSLETISLGAAVSLLNDLNWYLIRYTDAAIVFESSISESEWLSRDLAHAIRDGEIDPEESGRYLMVYGVEEPGDTDDEERPQPQQHQNQHQQQHSRLVEPMFVTRTGETLPEYDLRDVDETFVVRVTGEEFGN
jgi:hypothetical protein